MNQEFLVVVPERREFIRLHESLDDFLRQGHRNADFLVQRIAVPVRLHGTSGTPTLKKPVVDEVVHKRDVAQALKQQAIRELRPGRENPYRASRRSRVFTDPNAPQHEAGDKSKKYEKPLSALRPAGEVEKMAAGSELSNFLALPAELQLEVFKHLDLGSFRPICFANPVLCRLARVALEDRFMAELGTWAGKDIACLGTLTQPGDYPPGSYNIALRKQLPSGLSDAPEFWVLCEEDSDWDSDLNSEAEDANIDDDANAFFDENTITTPVTNTIIGSWTEDFEDLQYLPTVFARSYTCTDPDFIIGATDRFRRSLKLRYSQYYPTGQPWILRNLTTKEYVRAEAVAPWPECIHGPFIDIVGFGEVIMMRTSWTTFDGSSTGTEHLADYRGDWAGHAFDVTTLARHEASTKGQMWTDVSKEVRAELENYFGVSRYSKMNTVH